MGVSKAAEEQRGWLSVGSRHSQGLATLTESPVGQHFPVGAYPHPFTRAPETCTGEAVSWRETVAKGTKALVPGSGDTQPSPFSITLASFLREFSCTNVRPARSFSTSPGRHNC